MPVNKAVATLNTDLSKLNKALATQHQAEHAYNLDVTKEKTALGAIAAQEKAIVDQFLNGAALTPANKAALLGKIFALGEKKAHTEDAFNATFARDKKAISADAKAASGFKAQGRKDLLPAEYHLSLAETNKDRKALGLGAVNKVIRPVAPRAPKTSSYTVKSGDTMSAIAANHGVSLLSLEKANPQIHNPNLINVGQRITIPAHGQSGQPPVHTPPPTQVPPTTGGSAADQKRARALAFALRQANDPNVGYSQDMSKRLGQNQPGTSKRYYDCSGLVYEAYKSIGVTLGAADTRGMWASWHSWATQVPKDSSKMKPGDLVLINSSSPDEHHVLIYEGNGKCVAASTSNTEWSRQVREGDTAQSYFNEFGSGCIVLRPNV